MNLKTLNLFVFVRSKTFPMNFSKQSVDLQYEPEVKPQRAHFIRLNFQQAWADKQFSAQ